MYTVEMDHDEIKIILIDERDKGKEVEVDIYDDCVTIKQYHDIETFNIDFEDFDDEVVSEIMMTPEQFQDLMLAMKSKEGVYRTVRKKIK